MNLEIVIIFTNIFIKLAVAEEINLQLYRMQKQTVISQTCKGLPLCDTRTSATYIISNKSRIVKIVKYLLTTQYIFQHLILN